MYLTFAKQDFYPVFFLTESGHIPSADAIADSLQEAIHFARNWGLPGIIARSQPLVICPNLVKTVKSSDLLCISWGELNDQPENAIVSLTIYNEPPYPIQVVFNRA